MCDDVLDDWSKIMKFEEPIMGFINYKEKEYPYVYENNILKLFPPSVKVWKEEQFGFFDRFNKWTNSIFENEWIETIYLNGKTHDGYDISFFVLNSPSNNNGFISFQVIYSYKYDNKTINCEKIYGISLEGEEIDYFYIPSKVFEYNLEVNEKKGISLKGININKIKEELIGEYDYKDTRIKVVASIHITTKHNSNNPLLSKSKLKFIFSEPKDIEFAIDVYFHCKLFLCYICRRKNIQIESINTYVKEKDKFIENGIIKYAEKYSLENYLKKNDRIIQYNYLKGKLSELFNDIAKEKMYFEHLCSSIEETKFYNVSRIILNFVAFEREFRNIYSKEVIRSKEYFDTRKEVVEYLEKSIKNNSGNKKKKKYLKSFINTLNKAENSYEDRVQKALKDCEEDLLPFLKYYYKNYSLKVIDAIAKRMNDLRNDFAHGNMDLDFEAININDFIILECLLYAMRLKYIGVNKKDIQNSIKELMGINVNVS